MSIGVKVGAQLWVYGSDPKFLKLLERELSFPNPEYIKKQTLGLSTYGVPKAIVLFKIKDPYIIIPYGCLHKLCDICPNIEVQMELPNYYPIKYLDGLSPLNLYDYQQEAVDVMTKTCCGILQAPAGSGKTQMGLAIALKHRIKTLWISHTVDLVEQSKKRAEQFIDMNELGIIAAGRCKIGRFITFATVQSLANMDLEELRDEWGCIIVDECHRVAGTQLKMTQFSKILNRLAAKYKYGLSATVYRSDGLIKCTFALLGQVVHEVKPEVVADRILTVDVAPIALETPESDEYIGGDGMVNWTKYISYLCNNTERSRTIVNRLIGDRQYSCLILSDRVSHLQTMFDMLPADMQKDAVIMVSKTNQAKLVSGRDREKKNREEILNEMRTGKKKYMFSTYMLAKEGLDIPCLERLYMAVPHQSYAILIQAIGRIARVYEGKAKPLAYDFVDVKEPGMANYIKRYRVYKKNKIPVVGVE